jgi:hypothetical protein
MHMDKRLVILSAAVLILAMTPLTSAAPLGGPKTYTTVVGITLTLLPHNHLSLKSMNAIVVFYTIHQPLRSPKHGIYLLQHISFTGEFTGHIHHCVINGQFAGLPEI